MKRLWLSLLLTLSLAPAALAQDPVVTARTEVATACTLPSQWSTCRATLATHREWLVAPEDVVIVKDLDEKIAVWGSATPRTVGVLLPLSGPQAKVGEVAKKALEPVFASVGIKAIIEDSGGDPLKASAAALKLLTVDHVSGLIGPIGRQETAAVALIARRFYVPMVTLSVMSDQQSARATDFVMRLRTSPVEVAQALAREARARMGVTRAAVLYPDTDLGKEAATAFADEMQAAGGDVARLVAYDPKTTDFKPVMKALMQAEKPGKKVVADFDALFIPDSPDVVKRITPQLEAWRVPLRVSPLPAQASGVAAPKGKVTPVQLLGSSAWDSPLIVDKAEGLTDNAVFATPPAFEAEVADAARFIGSVLAKIEGADQDVRLALQEKLRQSRTEPATVGELRVTMGVVAPRVQLKTVHGMTIRERLAEDDERAQRSGAMSTP